MSAVPPKADMFSVESDVCFVPIADIAVACRVVGLVPKKNDTVCVRLARNTYLSVSCYHLGGGESVVCKVTIYRNPNCGTSRNVLGLIRNAGIEPTVIEYLKAPPDRQTLLGLLKRMEIRVRELLRRKGSPYDELGLDDPKWTDDQLIDTMIA